MTLAVHLYRRVLRKGRLIALLALSAVPGFTLWLTGFDIDASQVDSLYADIVSSVGYSFVIAVLILTVATLREERDAGTLPYLYMRPIGRLPMAVSSLAAGIAAALTLGVGGWVVSLIAMIAIGGEASTAMAGLVQYVGAGVGYAAIFVPLGYLVPRSILVGLGYIVVIESIMANVVTGLAQISIWRIALSIFADIATAFDPQNAGEMLGPVAPGMGGGLVKLAVVMVIGVTVLTWALKRRDAL